MMRLILIACIVMIGASAYADDHVCGEGPHEITIREEKAASCTRLPPLGRYGDGTGQYYRIDIGSTLGVYCGSDTYTVQEMWTDWPECDGVPVATVALTVDE